MRLRRGGERGRGQRGHLARMGHAAPRQWGRRSAIGGAGGLDDVQGRSHIAERGRKEQIARAAQDLLFFFLELALHCLRVAEAARGTRFPQRSGQC